MHYRFNQSDFDLIVKAVTAYAAGETITSRAELATMQELATDLRYMQIPLVPALPPLVPRRYHAI